MTRSQAKMSSRKHFKDGAPLNHWGDGVTTIKNTKIVDVVTIYHAERTSCEINETRVALKGIKSHDFFEITV